MDTKLKKDEQLRVRGTRTFAAGQSKERTAVEQGMHPDHSASKKRINRIKGQLDAVARMIEEREYCPDIIQQIRAATSALRGLESEVLRGHMRGCVKKAFESDNLFEVNDKIEEVLALLK